MVTPNNGSLRFEVGSQVCGVCGTKENIIQFERNTIRKKLPIIEIAFICVSCAKKNKLIEESTEIKSEE
jgi:hypothetical protein